MKKGSIVKFCLQAKSRSTCKLFFVLCLLGLRMSAEATVRINEFMSSNGASIADEDGDREDWIELFNYGTEPVNMAGWGLTDDREDPFQWVFPDALIKPGQFLLVYASGKDRRAYAEGEFLTALYPDLRDGTVAGAAGIWLFDEAEGEVVLDSSGQGNHGTLHGAVRVCDDILGHALQFTRASNDYVSIPNSPSLQTTNSMTLAMWVKPASLGVRQNPWDKAYGGEGTLTLDEDGQCSFYWGMSGANAMPYEQFRSSVSMPQNQWTHIAVMRDHERSLVRWYFNGELVAASNAPLAAKASSRSVRIGRGYLNTFDGRIARPVLLPYAIEDARLHANFKISAEGEWLQLSRPDGNSTDLVAPVAIPRDVSYGRSSQDPNIWSFFAQPTPGVPNTTPDFAEVVWEAPSFSVEGGFYDEEFVLHLNAADPEATILYTLDGSDPHPDNLGGKTYFYKDQYPFEPDNLPSPMLTGSYESLMYESPILIRDRSADPNHLSLRNTTFYSSSESYAPDQPVFKGSVVRARILKDHALPGPVSTHTYFVASNASTRYGLPVLSLSMDEDTLFDYGIGIYTAGKDFDDWREANPGVSTPGSAPGNYRRRGDYAEHPMNLEVFLPQQGRVFAQNLGYRIHGGWTRHHPQKSIRLYAKHNYDEENTMEFAFIPGLLGNQTGQPIESFRRLLLRNAGDDFDRSRLVDAFMQNLVQQFNLDQQGYQPAIHFINGEYWGMINIRERVDRYFFSSHHGIDPDHITILTLNATVSEGSPLDRQHFLDLRNFIASHDMAIPAHYDIAAGQMDMRNFILYNVAQIYCNNRDWPQSNVSYWRANVQGASPTSDGRWRWILFDMDWGFGNVGGGAHHNTLAHALNGSDWSRIILNRLLDNPEFRASFINAFADHMATTFQPARVHTLADDMAAVIAPYMPEHAARWRNQRDYSVDYIKVYGSARPAHMRQHLANQFNLSSESAMATLDIDGPGQGYLGINTITINHETPGLPDPDQPFPWSGDYFPGIPITVRAIPEPGHRFAGWLEFPDESSPTLVFDPAGGVTITALFEKGPEPVLVHYWNFNDSSVLLEPSFTKVSGANISLIPGPATEVVVGTGGDFFGENARLGDEASSHLRVNNPVGAVMNIAMPTLGYDGIKVMFEVRRSGKGAGRLNICYTTDGETYDELSTILTYDAAPVLITLDLNEVNDVANNPDFALRIDFEQGEGGTAGNVRFDNWTVEGVALPGCNQPPEIVALIGHQSLLEDGDDAQFDLEDVFEDPDDDEMTFDAETSQPEIVSVSLTGSALTVTPLARGGATITVTADDGENDPVGSSFYVLVNPSAFVLTDNSFTFGEWGTDEPAFSYPANMLFLQSAKNDPKLADDLLYAYMIPAADAAVPEDADYPYGAEKRTRINGLGEDGISFINTGRGRDVGGALLALDTRNSSKTQLSWTGGTIEKNTRPYAMRLQYRTGLSGDWNDLPDEEGHPVEYIGQSPGHTTRFESILLPAEIMGQEYVQLLWRYYFLDSPGASSQRDMLRLDDMVVEPVQPSFSSFESWQQSVFHPHELADPAISGALADPDEPGVPNLLRYAFGLTRRDALPAYQSQGGEEESVLYYEHRRLRDADESLLYWLEITTDLETPDWLKITTDQGTPFGPLGETYVEAVKESLNDDGRTKTLRYTLSPAIMQSGCAFIRLVISLPPE